MIIVFRPLLEDYYIHHLKNATIIKEKGNINAMINLGNCDCDVSI